VVKLGSYTYVSYTDVVIVDIEGLKSFFEHEKNNEKTKDYVTALRIEGNELDFDGLSGFKILDYWYPDFVNFLIRLARYVDGEISLTFETEELAGRIFFDSGECIIELGVMEWTRHKAQELLR